MLFTDVDWLTSSGQIRCRDLSFYLKSTFKQHLQSLFPDITKFFKNCLNGWDKKYYTPEDKICISDFGGNRYFKVEANGVETLVFRLVISHSSSVCAF